MRLKTCRTGLHQYDTETAPKIGKFPPCPECLRVARARSRKSEAARAGTRRYHSSEKGRAAVARYRQSEKGKATWRKQDERRRALRAQKREELAPAPQLLPGMRLCLNRLHQYDPTIVRKKNGRATCPECRRASHARYRRSERGRAVAARYFHSEKGQAAQARYQSKRKQRRDPSETT